ncbi:MAG: hypothetical protein K0S47_176 [Herbinix sp.]|jgi:predicted RNA-binding protein associated with RNAse of E/G family|nr:hypothetical protein [Herbinix sp.]
MICRKDRGRDGIRMKRKRLIYDDWTVISSKRYKQIMLDTKLYKGIVALLIIDEVLAPQIWEFQGVNYIACDKGVKWLQLIPDQQNYVITAMINAKNEIELWYIDMIADYGIDPDHIAYFHDLYLDLVVYPDGAIKEDDRDELDEAYEQKIITDQLHRLALETSQNLQEGFLRDISKLRKLCNYCYDEINECHENLVEKSI